MTAVPLVGRALELLSTLPRTLCNSSISLVTTITGQTVLDVRPLGVPGKGHWLRQCRTPPRLDLVLRDVSPLAAPRVWTMCSLHA